MSALSYLSPEDGFLGIPEKDAVPQKKAKAVIIPFGLESSVSYGGGTAKGPAAILKASHQVELFDEEYWSEPVMDYGVATLKEPKIKSGLKSALTQLENTVEAVLDAGKFPFILGGEHSLTAGSIRPFVKRHKKIGILHFDAHADLRDGYDGEHYSHAAALRRVLDHEQVVSHVSIGIRNISKSEIPYLAANKDRIRMFFAKDKRDWKIAEMMKPLKGLPVYLSFDIDGLDGSLMPATGTPEPGGLFWQDAMDILNAARKQLDFVGADLVELAPRKELHACDFLAAKLTYKMLSTCLYKK
jgi:agmatinase